MYASYIIFVILISLGVDCTEQFFPVVRSPILLNKWARAELNFVRNLESFFNVCKDGKYQQNATGTSVVSLCAYLLEYDDSRSNLQNICTNGEEAVDSVTNNPLASYLMIRRALIELTNFQEAVCKHEGSHSYFKNALRSFSHLPTLTMEDLRDASLAILRIGHVYGLQAQQIANGILMGMDIQVKLRAVHCFEIGMEAILQNFHVLSIIWLETALDIADDGTIEMAILQHGYDHAIQQHDETFRKGPSKNNPHVYDRELGPIKNNKHFRSIRQDTRTKLVNENGGRTVNDGFNTTVNYWLLCAGRDIQNPEVKSRLFCWYERSGPYLKIAPVKMEYLSKDPDVIHMYDVIGAKMITRLKALVSNNLRLSKGANYAQPYSPMLTATRTSVQNWVDDKKYKDLEILARDIEQFTKLSVYPKTSSELFQVAAYTFSGHYDFHLDAFKPNYSRIAENGNRIATFMYYLHSPVLGGRTAFPKIGVAANPIKGSAVFWYNIEKDGTIDTSTSHGACPVILGQKWVSNKWILQYDQFKTHKCGLVPSGKFDFRNNRHEKMITRKG